MRGRPGRWVVRICVLVAIGITQPAPAQPAGAKTQGKVAKRSRTVPPPASLGHIVRPGQTLRGIAREHGVSGWERVYGRVVKIWPPDDLMTVYAHNLENLVKVGDWVDQGQVIGTVGSTGRSSAPHLHFEIRLDGRKYNPAFWLPELEALAAPARDHRSPAATP